MSVNLITVFSHIIHNEQEQIKMNEEMKKIIDKALKDEYNSGRFQGIWEFYQQLKTTHATPEEIIELLNHRVH